MDSQTELVQGIGRKDGYGIHYGCYIGCMLDWLWCIYVLCTLSKVCSLDWEANQSIKDWHGMWPGNHRRWWKELGGLDSLIISQAELMVNFPALFPFQTRWSFLFVLGGEVTESQMAWMFWWLIGNFHISPSMMSDTFAFHGSPMKERCGRRSLNLLPSGS